MIPDPSHSGQKSGGRGAHGDDRNTRREARELALRMLFQIDVGKQPPGEVIGEALAQSKLEGVNREFCEVLVRGVLAHLRDLDARIRALTPDWTPDRQAAVDRSILRLAAFELLFQPESPVAAVVNEAVELAKKYSTAESGRFVNGVLGALARQPRGDAEIENAPEGDAPKEDKEKEDKEDRDTDGGGDV